MEVGAVKQAFNNELILLKKNLNQAKTQTIHKLTRKAKQLTEKKAPDALKEKLKRKAEFAVREVLVIKKIKAKDIGRFAITHTGKLQDYLNKPQIDNNKACARLLLHKALQEKYKLIRDRFSNISIKDLFMSRQERLKLKKEEKLKKKEKRNKKKGVVVNAEGDWDVEDVKLGKKKPISAADNATENSDDQDMSGEENDEAKQSENDPFEEKQSEDEENQENNEQPESGSDDETVGDSFKISFKEASVDDSEDEASGNEMEASDNPSDEDESVETGKLVKPPASIEKKQKKTILPKVKKVDIKDVKNTKLKEKELFITKAKQIENIDRIKPAEKKQKDNSKNKNLKEKILKKKFKKDSDDAPNIEKKVVDPFFITSTGENYLTIAEPRAPDEFKEEHRQGNRQLRRSIMFGHVPKPKRRQEFRQQNNAFDKQNGFDRRPNNKFDKQDRFNNDSKFDKFNKNNNRFDNTLNDNKRPRFNDRNEGKIQDEKPEKLHPSWEAKKKQSGILPFQGKKIVFDDS